MTRDEIEGERPPEPWWRFGMMWLVVGSVLAVVLASTAMAIVAVRGGDTPVRDAAVSEPAGARAPAHQARNHAATGGRR
jgi:hypothetical protein